MRRLDEQLGPVLAPDPALAMHWAFPREDDVDQAPASRASHTVDSSVKNKVADSHKAPANDSVLQQGLASLHHSCRKARRRKSRLQEQDYMASSESPTGLTSSGSLLRSSPVRILSIMLSFVLFATTILAAPTQIFLSPINSITGVALTEPLIITFSETVFAKAGGYVRIYDYNSDLLLQEIEVTSAKVGGSGSPTITITPDPFMENTRYYVLITSDAFEGLTGTPFAGIAAKNVWFFSTADYTPPSIVTLTPLHLSTNVNGGVPLQMTFNEVVKAFPGSSAQIQVIRASDSSVVCTISCSPSPNFQGSETTTISLSCPSKLPDLTTYVVSVPNLCISDASDNPFEFVGSWQFTTGDYTPPTVLTYTPTHLSSSVPLTQVLSLHFSEAVTADSGAINLRKALDNSVIVSIPVTSGQITGSGTTTINIQPSSPLPDSTEMFVEIASTAFVDSNGNYFAGISGSSVWRFTTVDLTPPSVASLTPNNGATGVSTSAELKITFTERVFRSNSGGVVQIRAALTDTIVQTISLMSSAVRGSGTDTIRFLLSAPLSDMTQYYVIVPASAFLDGAGNAFAGITASSGWRFQTGDFTPPTLVALNPAHLSTNIVPTATVTLTFSEATYKGTGIITFLDSSSLQTLSTTNATDIQGDGTSIITIPHDPLPEGVQVTVVIPPGALRDASGNAFTGLVASQWLFTIGDYSPPAIVTLDPSLGSRDVPTNVHPTVTFNEDIAVIAGGTASLYSYDGLLETIALDDPSRAQVNGNVLTLIPANLLPTETFVWVLFNSPAIRDLSVNQNVRPAVTSSDVWNFTTIDVTPPTLVATYPVQNSVGARTNATLILTFSEPVKTIAGGGSFRIYQASDNTLLRTVVAADGAAVLGSGTNQLEIPFGSQHLPENTKVYVLVPATAISDLATPPNYFAGLLTPDDWTWTTGDWIPPVVVQFNPEVGETNVPVNVQPSMQFDKNVTVVAGGVISLYNNDTNTLVESFTLPSARVTGSGSDTITISPTSNLLSKTKYYILITPGSFIDPSWNEFAGLVTKTQWYFESADTTPPTLVSVSPAHNSVGVPTQTELILTFSEAVRPRLLPGGTGAGSVHIYTTNTGALRLSIPSHLFGTDSQLGEVSLRHAIPLGQRLASLTNYYVLIDSTAFEDVSGNAFGGVSSDQSWRFATRDDDPPAILSTVPAHSAEGVSLTTSLIINFDEIVYVRTGTLLLRRKSDGVIFSAVNVETAIVLGSSGAVPTANAPTMYGNGTAVVSISLGQTLPAATEFYVTFPSTVFADSSNNYHPGYLFSTEWSFTTFDNIPPVVVARSPAHQSTDAGLLDPIIITFNKQITTVNGAGTISLRRYADDAIVESWTLPSASITGSGTNTLTIARTVSLVDLTQYYVSIPATAIQDQSGNWFAGYTTNAGYYFTTGDITPPYVIAYQPPHNSNTHAPSSPIGLTFSKAVHPQLSQGAGVYYVSIYRASDNQLITRVDVTNSTAVTGGGTAMISIQPPILLPERTLVYVMITTGAFRDNANRPYAGITDDATWRFTVADDAAPLVVSFSPAVGATNVPVNTNLVMTFSEAVTTQSAGTGAISIFAYQTNTLIERIDVDSDAVTNGIIAGVGTSTLTITLSAPLPANTLLYVIVSSDSFQDTWGNPYAGTTTASQWYFTTVDTLPPEIIALSPIEESVGASLTTRLVIVFDEAVQYDSGLVRVVRHDDDVTVWSVSMTSAQVTQTTFAGHHTVDITTTGMLLDDNTMYYVLVDANAFYDFAGNYFGGIASKTRWRFTTGDFNAPVPLVYVPQRDSLLGDPAGPATLTFNEPIVLKTGCRVEIRAESNGALVQSFVAPAAQLTVTNSDTLSIAHSRLQDLTRYYILISSNCLSDTAGNVFAGFSSATDWAFRTRDATPPVITSVSPSPGDTTVVQLPTLIITFSKSVLPYIPDPASGDPLGTLEIVKSATASNPTATVVESMGMDSPLISIGNGQSAGPQLFVDLSVPLDDFTRYHVLISSNAIQDTAGNFFAGLSSSTAWYFSTGDNTPPAIVALSPSHMSTNAPVATTSPITLTFDEVVYPRAGMLSIYDAATNALYTSISVTSTTQVVGSGTQTLQFYPTQQLVEGTQYYVLLPATAISDQRNNYFAGFLTPTSYVFTTGHFSPPTVMTFFPAHAATNVPTTSILQLTFNKEVVVQAGGTIVVRNNATNAVIASIPITDAVVSGSGTNTLVIDRSPTEWPDSVVLTVSISTGAVKDLYGNEYEGLATGSWYFTMVDLTPPSVTARNPAHGTTTGRVTGELSLTFNEFVQLVSGSAGSLRLYLTADDTLVATVPCNSASITAPQSVTGEQTSTLTFNVGQRLVDLTSYYVLIDGTGPDACISDLAGNTFAGYSASTDWRFTTGDFTPPTVTVRVPDNGETGVPVTTSLTITFNENVQQGSPLSGVSYFRILLASDLSLIRRIPASSAAGYGTNTLTVPLNTGPYVGQTLKDGTKFCVALDSDVVKDAANNGYTPTGLELDSVCDWWSFTTIDLTPPAVSSLVPIVGNTRVPITPTLVITFNEPVRIVRGGGGLLRVTDQATGVVVAQASMADMVVVQGGEETPAMPNVVTIALTQEINEKTLCVVTVDNGNPHAFEDLEGNPFQGFATTTTSAAELASYPYMHPGWNFTIGDFTPPKLVSLSPANNTQDAAIDAPLVLTFDEPIRPVTADENVAAELEPDAQRIIRVYRAADDSLVHALDPASPTVASQLAANSIRVQPASSDWTPATHLYVSVPPRAIADRDGNLFEGLTESLGNIWRFLTQTPPHISYAYPNHTVSATGTRMVTNFPIMSGMPTGGPAHSFALLSYPDMRSGAALPTGVSFDTTTGEFKGFPSEPWPTTMYYVRARNSGGTHLVQVNLTVTDAPPPTFRYVFPLEPVVDGMYVEVKAPTVVDDSAISFNPAATSFAAIWGASLAQSGYMPQVGASTTIPHAVYRTNVPITPAVPEITSSGGTITHFSSSPPLPVGLILDPQTGIISGTPRRADAEDAASIASGIVYNITGSNTGGSVWTLVSIAVTQGPIRFGVPDWFPSSLVTTVQNFLTNVVAPTTTPPLGSGLEPLSFEAVRVGTLNDVRALDTYEADIVVVDALGAFMAAQRQNYRLLAVSVIDQRTDYSVPAQPSQLTTGYDAVAYVRKGSFTTFLQLEGRRACTGGYGTATMASVMHWARTKSTSAVKLQALYEEAGGNVAFTDPSGTARPFEACNATLLAMTDGFFDRTCNPPSVLGGAGRCGLCPSIKRQDCSGRNAFATDAGAIRGLLEGVCDVAFVQRQSVAALCSPRTGYTPPTWCQNGVGYTGITVLPEMLVNSKLAPTVPSYGLLIRRTTFSNMTSVRLQTAMINYWHTQPAALSQQLLAIFGPGVTRLTTPDGSTPGDFSTSQGPLSSASTQAHLVQYGFTSLAQNFAGVSVSLACAAAGRCVAPHVYVSGTVMKVASSNPNNLPELHGVCPSTLIGTEADPIRLSTGRALNSSEAFLLSKFFATATSLVTLRATVNEIGNSSPTLVSSGSAVSSASSFPTGLPAASVIDLHQGLVDVVLVDAGTALLASLRFGHVVLAVTGEPQLSSAVMDDDAYSIPVSNNTEPLPSVSTVAYYRITDPTHEDVAGPFSSDTTPSFADLRGLRSCHGSFSSATGTLLPAYYGRAMGLIPDVTVPSANRMIDACHGSLEMPLRSFFSASCAPPTSINGTGICDLCDASTPCDQSNRYAGEIGALRGLAERACEVAFVRNTTYDQVCGHGPTTPAGLSNAAGYPMARPDWCDLIPRSKLGTITELDAVQNTLTAPEDVFLVRRDSITPEGLVKLRSTLLAMNDQPALLATISSNGGLRGIRDPPGGAPVASDASTVSTLQHLEDTFVNIIPGFDEFNDCHGRSVEIPDWTSSRCLSMPPTTCTSPIVHSGSISIKPSHVLASMSFLASIVLSYLYLQ